MENMSRRLLETLGESSPPRHLIRSWRKMLAVLSKHPLYSIRNEELVNILNDSGWGEHSIVRALEAIKRFYPQFNQQTRIMMLNVFKTGPFVEVMIVPPAIADNKLQWSVGKMALDTEYLSYRIPVFNVSNALFLGNPLWIAYSPLEDALFVDLRNWRKSS